MKKLVMIAAMMVFGAGACVESEELELGSEEAEISCSGQSCDGLMPNDTPCKLDASIVADGRVFQGGTQIGGLALFYSPSCQAVFTASAYYQFVNHRTCAVRRNAFDNQQICKEYWGSRGNDSPLRYIGVGKTAFGRTVLIGNESVAGRTGDWTRTY